MTAGRGWAWTGFGLGVAVSVAGNIAHTWHPSQAVLRAAGKTADQWRPELGAQLIAAFFPIALLITVEVLARVSWPRTWGWSATRYGSTSLVAVVAAIVSYGHLNGLMHAYGEDDLTALIGPLSVDGLMVLCGFALIAIGRTGQPVAVVAEQPERIVPAHPEPVVVDLVEVRPAPVEVVDEPLAEDLALVPGIQDFAHPDQPAVTAVAAGQEPVTDLPSAVRSAKAAGLSQREIVEAFPVTRYQVRKFLAEQDAPEPQLVSASLNGHPTQAADT